MVAWYKNPILLPNWEVFEFWDGSIQYVDVIGAANILKESRKCYVYYYFRSRKSYIYNNFELSKMKFTCSSMCHGKIVPDDATIKKESVRPFIFGKASLIGDLILLMLGILQSSGMLR